MLEGSSHWKGVNLSRRSKLQHPSRTILLHLPTALLERLDADALAAQTSRSELIRRRLDATTSSGRRNLSDEFGASDRKLVVQKVPTGGD